MTDLSTKRNSGLTPAVEEAIAASARSNELADTLLPGENEVEPTSRHREKHEPKTRTPGFTRMRLDWNSEDRPIMKRLKDAVDGTILRNFQDAYQIMNDIYDYVRLPLANADGEPLRDQWGFKQWMKLPDGTYDEDFTRLTIHQKEHLLLQITTRLFAWESTSADMWGTALMAKTQWEERYSSGFDAAIEGTVDARNARGRLESLEERYFAVYQSYVSKRADALVRSMALIAMRLKDAMG